MQTNRGGAAVGEGAGSADRRGLRFAETSQQASVADVNASHTYTHTYVNMYLCAFACVLITRVVCLCIKYIHTYVYAFAKDTKKI